MASLAAVKQGDSAEPASDHVRFVRELFECEQATLFKYLLGLLRHRADAEDTLQETYVRLLETDTLARDSYARARSYAFKIATNLAYDRFRKRRPSSPADATEPEATGDSALQFLSFEQSLAALKEALMTLKPRCRRVFLLRVAEGLSYEAIASALGVSKRTVEREMKHALDTCRAKLAED